MSAVKHDGAKDPWHLLPYDAIRCVVYVLAFGAKKYAERNWEGGMDWSRLFGALQRHLTAWWQGDRKDSETGYSHLWHAGCCILFLIAYELRGIGRDDRPIISPHVESAGINAEVACGRHPMHAEALLDEGAGLIGN